MTLPSWPSSTSQAFLEEANPSVSPVERPLAFSAHLVLAQVLDRMLDPQGEQSPLQSSLVAGSAQNLSDAVSSLNSSQRQNLTQRLGRGGLSPWLSLSEESDGAIFYSDLYSLATPLRRRGRQQEAGAVLGFLSQNNSAIPASVRERALRDYRALVGDGGSLGLRLEFLGDRFVEEAFHPATIGGMALGQLAYAPARAFFLSRFLNPTTGRFLLGSLGSRAAASTLATALEVPVFWGASKGINEWMHPGQQAWDLHTNLTEMAGLALTLGVLRTTGFAARSAVTWANRPALVGGVPLLSPWVRGMQSAFPATATIGGLYLAHWAQESLGIRGAQSSGNRLLDSVVFFFQFGISGRIAHGFLGRGFQQWNLQMEESLARRESAGLNPLPPGGGFSETLTENLTNFLMPSRRLLPAGIPEGWIAMSTRPENLGRPTIMAMSSLEGTSRSRPGPAERLPEFLERAKQSELSILKDIVLAVYEEVAGRPPQESVQRYFQYTDPESWRSGINILTGGREMGLRVREALEKNPAFLDFVRRWEGRPHFIHVGEIPRVRERGLGHNASITNQENALLKALLRSPDLSGMREFIQDRMGALKRHKTARVNLQSAETPGGGKVYLGNVGRLGLVLSFGESGVLKGPIFFRSNFSEKALAQSLSRFQAGEGQALLAEMFAPPRFRNAREVLVEKLEGHNFTYSSSQAIVKVQELFAEHPNLEGFRRLFRGNKMGPLVQRGGSDGSKAVALNRGKLGLIVQFDGEGQLVLPIRVRSAFSSEDFADPNLSFLPRMEASNSPINPEVLSSRSNPLWPRRDENPTEYGLRFLRASQDHDNAAQLNLVRTMEALLQTETTSQFGRELITRLKSLTRDLSEGSGALVREYQLPGLAQPLTIFSPITTFLPENWSQFFAQQVRTEIQRNGQPVRRAVEIGTGTGWLSIYLRKLGLVQEMEGGDYTETAPVVSRINAMINNVDGLRFVQSDLWENISKDPATDLVVACIPQIPRTADMISQRGFADYTPARDNFMKPYGLGLIYDALRQSQPHLSERGRILLNLAGRPGLENLLEMYRRTGFHPIVRHHEIIPQDSSTDISPLSTLEENFPGVRFQFLPPQGSEATETLSATEALGVPGVRHHQYLIEGQPYANNIRRALFGEQGLPSRGRWGYTEDPGSENPELRSQLAQRMSREWGSQISEEVLFIGPNHEVLLEGLLRINTPEAGRILWVGESTGERIRLQEAVGNRSHENFPADLELLVQSIEKGEAQGVVLHLPRLSWNRSAQLENLLSIAGRKEVPLIFVEAFAPRDSSGANPLVRSMASHPTVGSNTVLLQAWDQRLGVTGLPLSVAVIGNTGLHQSLARYAEVSYSRVSGAVQEVYLRALRQLPDWENSVEARQLPIQGSLEPLLTNYRPLSSLRSVLEMPSAFETSPTGGPKKPVIDMSFGESEWEAPVDLSHTLERLSQRYDYEAVHRETLGEVLRYLEESRGVTYSPEGAILGYGVHPLLFSTLRALRASSSHPLRVWVPRGSYGLFYPTVEAAGSRLGLLDTLGSEDYLVNAANLDAQLRNPSLARLTKPVLLLNSPTNPAGRYYSEAQLRDIARVLQRHRGILLWDDVFGMTHLKKIPYERSTHWETVRQEMGDQLVAFGGISKEFGAGGLRLGWALTDNGDWAPRIRRQVAAQPDVVGMSVAGEYLAQWPKLLPHHQNYLAHHRRILTELLDSRSIPYHDSEGGFALLADFSGFFRNRRQLNLGGGQRVAITPENFHHLLYTEAGIKVKASEWSQTPNRYRFVFSIHNLEDAVERLKIFFRNAR